METSKIIISIVLFSLFGFALTSFIIDFTGQSKLGVTLDSNYTALSNQFQNNTETINSIASSMRESIEGNTGFITTTSNLIFNGAYAIITMPFALISLAYNTINLIAGQLIIPSIYVTSAITIFIIILIAGLISLVFGKDW